MSVLSFQQALCDFISSPKLQKHAIEQSFLFFQSYDLTALEKERLLNVAQQKGMRINNQLYFGNRITPLYTMLTYTTLLLGEDFIPLAEEYIHLYDEPDLQSSKELELFVCFLVNKIREGTITNPYINEMLHFEAALTELRLAPRNMITKSLIDNSFSEEAESWMVHPLLRVIHFKHSPPELFEQLVNKKRIETNLPEGDYYLLLDGKTEEPEFKVIHPIIGQLLIAIKTNPYLVSKDNAKDLFKENLIVFIN